MDPVLLALAFLAFVSTLLGILAGFFIGVAWVAAANTDSAQLAKHQDERRALGDVTRTRR